MFQLAGAPEPPICTKKQLIGWKKQDGAGVAVTRQEPLTM
jgi:hypothetical protein